MAYADGRVFVPVVNLCFPESAYGSRGFSFFATDYSKGTGEFVALDGVQRSASGGDLPLTGLRLRDGRRRRRLSRPPTTAPSTGSRRGRLDPARPRSAPASTVPRGRRPHAAGRRRDRSSGLSEPGVRADRLRPPRPVGDSRRGVERGVTREVPAAERDRGPRGVGVVRPRRRACAAGRARASARLTFPLEQHVLRHAPRRQGQRHRGRDPGAAPPDHHGEAHGRAAEQDLLDAQRALEQALAASTGVPADARGPRRDGRLGPLVLPRTAAATRRRQALPALPPRRPSRLAAPPRSRAPRCSTPSASRAIPRTRLEQNDVCLLFRSDSLAHIATATTELFDRSTACSRSRASARASSAAAEARRRACRSRWRCGPGFPAARLDPRQRAALPRLHLDAAKALGPELIANLETLPDATDQWPNGYFREGTTMHVSHLHEDLEPGTRASPTSGGSGPRSGPASPWPTER